MNRFFIFNTKGLNKEDFIEVDKDIDLSNCDDNLCIKSVSTLNDASVGDLSFFTTTLVSGNKYVESVKNTKASFCLIKKQHSHLLGSNTKAIITTEPYITFTRLCKKFIVEKTNDNNNIINSDKIAKNVIIGNGVKIGKNVIIDDFVKVGNGVEIGDNTIIKSGVKIGNNCIIGRNCILRENCVIQYSEVGDDCIFHSNCSIGQDGFGFAFDSRTGYNEKINHFGYVKIGNRVEIGSNTCIDRGVFEATIIDDDVKLDNLVQIAHGVRVGKGTMMAGQTGIAGSAVIGKYCMLGGKSGVAGHIKLGDQCILYGATNISKGFTDKTRLIGTPGEPYNIWVKNYALIQNLIKKAKNNKTLRAKVGIKHYINRIIRRKK